MSGFAVSVMRLSSQIESPSLGKGGPPLDIRQAQRMRNRYGYLCRYAGQSPQINYRCGERV
ncbi:hypothetical protein EQW76_28105 [Rhizobium sp. rho-13.1]|nr:hypothetical protein EQW76_28105 [Rhizobium sp. rho-13.1]TQY05540.1 hypothetical protein EQW74_27365 [Rhizobium sp. rho-1.1]